MKAILPVAGNGTRMYPLGITTPKCLVPILNKPLLVWSLEALLENHITEVVLVISAGKFGQKIRDYVEQELTLHYPQLSAVTIHFAIQEQQLGTAHVVQMAKDFFTPGEEFFFMYGDDLYGPQNIAAILATPGLAVMGMKVNDPEKWGIFQADTAGNLQNVVEKPDHFVGDLANIGCMKLNTQVFELFDSLAVSPRGEYELTDTLQILANQGPVKVVATADYWIPIGYPWHLLDATEYFVSRISPDIKGAVENNVTIKGAVRLPASSSIKAGTYIEGNVVVGENTIIGPNSYIRGNTAIGDNCLIGFASDIKNSVIGNGTRVPHHGVIGDSILGEDVNFAAHSVAANFRHDGASIHTPIKGKMTDTGRHKFGTVIGNKVKIGVNTTIYPGRKIWPNRTTLPGEVVNKDLVE